MSHVLANSPRSRRLLALVSGGLATAAVIFFGWFAFVVYAVWRGGMCISGDEIESGWGEKGLAAAVLLSVVLWTGGGVTAWLRPGETRRKVRRFTWIYAATLVVIGLVSPLLWEAPPVCNWDIPW